ncbi:Rieske (2Fe-2S) protein [Streptomyces sp. B1866]|uniref:Rieske (2Fe-2S) protein n=1 Tax=Streptomyces sp. B1866 TaxID=3075431 RepID=UPI00288C91E5|nr:Rieske (2Fe-2S) protein [Streptomyces sp. B1866]MDT3399292.1 Rieske (2Fe-2S) protein [Streptomyces sp. B1866]
MTRPSGTGRGTARRTVVAAAGAAGLAAVLAACGDDGTDEGGAATAGTDGGKSSGKGSGQASGTGSDSAEPGGGDTEPLARTTDIPEGGGVVFARQKVVVTQPAAGDFRAFSAVCTHEGCVVREVAGGTINCKCHGSAFDIADGSVKKGPAIRPLPERTVTVQGGSLTVD